VIVVFSDMSQGGTVLVTGGAGYVGSHAALRLLQEGNQVVVTDNLSNASKDPACSQPESLIRVQVLAGKRLYFYPIDLKDKQGLRKVFQKHKIDCVMHFAALKSVSESVSQPLKYYSNNVTGTLSLLEVMEEFNVRKLIYSSSSTVYGRPKCLPLTEEHPTGQEMTNPYGKTKHMTEQILEDLCTANKHWKVISLRYFNPVGAHKSGKIGEDPLGVPNNLMPYVAQVAVGKRPFVQVYGNDYNTPDGTGVRDYIHIEDLAEGHVRALDRIASPLFGGGFKAYNLGTGRGHSVFEVIRAFSEAAGVPIDYRIVGRRAGDIDSSYCDASLANNELQWVATRDLRQMCEDAWRWQEANPDGFKTNPLRKESSL